MIPEYLKSDRGPIIGNTNEQGESWDSYIVRKMTEETDYKRRVLKAILLNSNLNEFLD